MKVRDRLSKGFSLRDGFTVVELLVVIVVIGILATIVVVSYRGSQDKARAATVSSDLRVAGDELEIEQGKTGTFPATTGAANGGKGLSASPGTTYQYTVDNVALTYCLTATNGSIAYNISQDGTPKEGVCTGHTAPSSGGGGTPLTCPTGFVKVPGNSQFGTSDFCIAKYETKNVGGVATSQASGLPWASVTQATATTLSQAACSGCGLITEAQWLTVAHNALNVASNWTGGSVGSGSLFSGHNDGSPASLLAASSTDSDGYNGTSNVAPSVQRRTLTLSNGEVVWDLAGNIWEWTSGTVSGGQPGSNSFAWRQWNAVVTHGTLNPDPFPAYGTPAASGWSSGIGGVYSNSASSTTYGMARGGLRDTGATYGGVFALSLTREGTLTYSDIGFRMTKQ